MNFYDFEIILKFHRSEEWNALCIWQKIAFYKSKPCVMLLLSAPNYWTIALHIAHSQTSVLTHWYRQTHSHTYIHTISLWNTTIQDPCTVQRYSVCAWVQKVESKLPLFFISEKVIFFTACVDEMIRLENFILMSASITGNTYDNLI